MITHTSIARVGRSAGRGMLSAVAFLITLIGSQSCSGRKEKVHNVDQALSGYSGDKDGDAAFLANTVNALFGVTHTTPVKVSVASLAGEASAIVNISPLPVAQLGKASEESSKEINIYCYKKCEGGKSIGNPVHHVECSIGLIPNIPDFVVCLAHGIADCMKKGGHCLVASWRVEGAGEGMTLSSWKALKRLPGINADRVAEATLQRSENGWQLMNLTLRPYGWGKCFPEQSSRCSQGKEGIFYVAIEKSLLPAIEKLMAAELDSRNVADSLAVEEVKSSGLLVGLTGGVVAGMTGVRAVERVESVQELTAVLRSIPLEVRQVHVMMGGICR